MAEDAMTLLQDPEMLAQFRKNALEQAQRFDISVILPQYEAYYEKILFEFSERLESGMLKPVGESR